MQKVFIVSLTLYRLPSSLGMSKKVQKIAQKKSLLLRSQRLCCKIRHNHLGGRKAFASMINGKYNLSVLLMMNLTIYVSSQKQ